MSRLSARMRDWAERWTGRGFVAEYEVVESWKGAGVGSRFRVRIAVNYWEPQFPIALVGQRFVITAFATRPSSRMVSTTLPKAVEARL